MATITESDIRAALAAHRLDCRRFGRAPIPDAAMRRRLIHRGFVEASGARVQSGGKEFAVTAAGEAFLERETAAS